MFNAVYNSDDNLLLCAPAGSGKTTVAELAVLRLLSNEPAGRCVYIVAKEQLAELLFQDWHHKFQQTMGVKVKISGN